MNTIEYFRAWNDFEDADSDLMKLAVLLQSFAGALRTTANETCFVGLAAEEIPFLAELMGGEHWLANDFPTPEALQSALRTRWFARARADSLWQKLTPAERKGAPSLRP